MTAKRVKQLKTFTVLGALFVAAGKLIAPVDAQVNPPNTPVFSDDSVFVPEIDAASTVRGLDPFEGTGEISEEAGVELAPDVEGLDALAPVTSGVGIETVIGFDSRVKVYTTSYPARAVALVTSSGGQCTGWLYGPNIVATAGHCVHSGGTGGTWFTNVRVFPGYNSTLANPAPYGSCTARWTASVTGWTRDRNERYDYGVVKLNCNVGNTVGWFGLWWQSASLTGLPTIISGYPGDKNREQWWSFDEVRVTQARQVFYLNDTIGGMSGSPVYNDRPAGSPFCANGPCAMAIHAYGLHNGAPHNTNNHGTRIVQAVFNNLIAWRDAP